MINLLKADFRRYSRTKLLYIVALINLVLALFTILFTYWFVDESLLGEFTQGGYGYFLTALNPSNNGGLLIGIIISAVVSQEFSYGTIRNKIIVGHRRSHVYLSLLLSSLVVATILFLINITTTGILATILFGYSRQWNADECLHLLATIGLGTMIYLFFAMIAFLFGTIIRNQGGATFGYIFGILLINLTIIIEELQFKYPRLIDVIMNVHPVGQLSTLMSGDLSGKLAIYILITIPIYYLLLGGMGYYIFKKRDLH